ncbi:hypothetical protein ACFLZQ_00595 [Thermodesulfobacteriota bacterium]
MKCYNHPERDSIAICKSCGKAICHECAQESENGIACQQSCRNSLSKKKELYINQAAHLKNLKRMHVLGSFFSIGMGLLFIYFSSQGFGLVYDFVFLLGVGFTVYGVVAQFVNMLILFKARKNSKQ